ncbi:hypothetical protein DMUE_4828 [Dictyocoela muelleri]|nr:hypothetical protein DMUE_4828 [Dictyocoela muelleri]
MFVKSILILAFVPENMIIVEYEKISKTRENNEYYDLILNFFHDNFINNEKSKIKNKNFWSANERILNEIPTTTNSCEAYHKHLNRKIDKKNMPLMQVIDVF